MLNEIGVIAAAMGGLTLAGATIRAWQRTRFWKHCAGRADANHRFCPGMERGLWRAVGLIWPWRWFIRSGCGYDLGGHLATLPAEVRCPECGVVSYTRRLTRRRRQIRWVNIGVVLLAASITLVCFDPPGARRTAKRLPTEALLWLELGLNDRNHEQFRQELIRRGRTDRLSHRQTRWLLPRLIDNLGRQSGRRTVGEARAVLAAVWPLSEKSVRAALVSNDVYQRQRAAELLRARVATPDHKLLRETLAGLRADTHGPVKGCYEYLSRWYDHARPHIVNGIDSNDAQQRLICAGMLALHGEAEYAERFAPILVEHLRDNDHWRDAIFASKALHTFGPDVIPLIEHAVAASDPQQSALTEHIIYSLEPDLAINFPAPAPPVLSSRNIIDPLVTSPAWIPIPRVD